MHIDLLTLELLVAMVEEQSLAKAAERARQIEREVDESKRKTLVRQPAAILESDPPLLPIAYEKIYDAWHNRVRGQNPSTFFGIYDVVRRDTVSLTS
jgi:hypothetical protein